MARTKQSYGISANLQVNGRDLPEYDANDEDLERPPMATVTKYVEIESGANFAVKVHRTTEFKHPNYSIECDVYLDGNLAYEIVLKPTQQAHDEIIEGITSFEHGQYVLRRFAFADLHTDDGPARQSHREELKDLGCVSVKCHRVRETSESMPLTSERAFKPTAGSSIPEKALKGRAISSTATLAEAQPSFSRTEVYVQYLNGKHHPFATFNFKYRTRKDLQAEMIIPRSPSPVPLEERDPNSLTAEEARELVRRQREQLQNMVKIKVEKRAASSLNKDSDVEERSRSPKRHRPSSHRDSGVEIVDLCGDDD